MVMKTSLYQYYQEIHFILIETYHVTIKKRPNKKGIKQSLFAPTYLYHRSRKAHLSCKCLRFNVPEEDGAFIQLLNKKRSKIFYVILKRYLKYLLKFEKIMLSSRANFEFSDIGFIASEYVRGESGKKLSKVNWMLYNDLVVHRYIVCSSIRLWVSLSQISLVSDNN